MRNAVIIPTGDEIISGAVLDTDSPEIMAQLLKLWPMCRITKATPVADEQSAILKEIDAYVARQTDLIVLVGGSGGGHRHSATLGKDFTHSALEEYLEEKHSREIYGANGHLWCKLICGRKRETLLINLPGPFAEAKAAMQAFCGSWEQPLPVLNDAMAQAVVEQYPKCGA